jgi:DNA modification methylase
VADGTDRRVEYVPLSDVRPAPRNPKAHLGDAIRGSISRFGLGELPLIDERTGRLVAGHGRIDQLTAMRADGQDAPEGVRVASDGGWLVPVVRGWSSRSDTDAEAYLVASNSLTALGGWDDGGLAELLGELAEFDPALLEVTGYSQGDLEDMLAGLDSRTELPPALNDPDEVPGVPVTPRSVLGDVWLLGEHRLLVGDSTDVAAVEAMLGGDRADCMWTDPPYGVDYNNFATPEAARAARRRTDGLRVANDGAADLPGLLAGAFATATAALKPGAAVYIAHPPGALSLVFAEAITTAGWSLRQQLVWVKDSLVLGHNDYHYRHEPIWMAYTDGGEGRRGRGGDNWFGDHSQTTVFEIPKPARSLDHPTMKPVALIEAMLANSCPRGGLVYEPFAGSGSTLLAAHALGMRVAAVEVDPKYADVICRRYQEHVGEKPVLASTHAPMDFCGDADE